MAGIRSFEYYVQRFLLGVSYTQNVQYESRESVKRNNQGTAMYRKAATSVGKYYPDRICEFASLLTHEDRDTRIACAVCIGELMDADPETRVRALELIKDVAKNGDPIERFGFGVWLKRHGDE